MTPRRSPHLEALARAHGQGNAAHQVPARPVTPVIPAHRAVARANEAATQPFMNQDAPSQAASSRPPATRSSAVPALRSSEEARRSEEQDEGPVPNVPTLHSGQGTQDSDPTPAPEPAGVEAVRALTAPQDVDPQPSLPALRTQMTLGQSEEMFSPGVFRFPDGAATRQPPATTIGSEVDSLPPGGKPSRKNLTVEHFTGFVPPGEFDSGVRRWWRKFMDQLGDAQILDGHKWSDMQCRSIFAASLAGDAADWYAELRAMNHQLTMEAVGRLLVEKYKSKLPEQELISRIMMEPKLRQETYQEYAQRLLNMADSLPGGLIVDANARHAMHTFMKRAYFKYSDELKSFAGRLSPTTTAIQKLHAMVDHLAYMAESDGRLPSKPVQGSAVRANAAKQPKSESQLTPGAYKAFGTFVEHKHKKPQGRRAPKSQDSRGHYGGPNREARHASPDTSCFNCHERGHYARDCPNRRDRTSTNVRLQGSAAAALKDESA